MIESLFSKSKYYLLLFFIINLLFLTASAQNHQKISQQTTLKIGTKIAKPFSMKDSDGKWHGISIKLWEKIAKKLNIKYVWVEHSLPSLLKNVETASLDAGIAAITINAEREKYLDFSHSYYSTGFSIATAKDLNAGWSTVISGIFSKEMLYIILSLIFVLFIIGTFTWLIERKKNPGNFHPNPIRGIAAGIWWAAVTMTTVGYGDMTPRTFGGRLIALFWMFASLLMVSAVIGGVASTLTLAKTKPLISTPSDLNKGRVGSIEQSSSDTYLKSLHIKPHYYPSVPDALAAIHQKKIEAVVYDDSLLKYLIQQDKNSSLQVSNDLFEPQDYGIIFPEGSQLRERVNRALLEIIHRQEWQRVLDNYLGKK